MNDKVKRLKEFGKNFGAKAVDEIMKKFELKCGRSDKISRRIDERTAIHELYYKEPTIH